MAQEWGEGLSETDISLISQWCTRDENRTEITENT